jgi:hypothetical protein
MRLSGGRHPVIARRAGRGVKAHVKAGGPEYLHFFLQAQAIGERL